MSTTVIVPTYNEEPNIAPLLKRIDAAVRDVDAEILFVDDSVDDTPDAIRRAATTSRVPVAVLHREHNDGGLSGAVVAGIRASTSEWCVVMDADLQHPPELIPTLLKTAGLAQADVVVASRHCRGGRTDGLGSVTRHAVSSASGLLARAMFPMRLHDCTDPMTGFFAIRRNAMVVDELRPHGFKILLEILARNSLRVVEVPFVFADRFAGESKANLGQGLQFLQQLVTLRFGRLSRFALIGAVGALLNLAIMGALIAVGAGYLIAAMVAAAITIIGNFLLQERYVFHDLRHHGPVFWSRFARSAGFNSVEAAVRLPFLAWIVEVGGIAAVPAQALTLLAAFLIRYAFHIQVVYRRRVTRRPNGPTVVSTDAAAEPASRAHLAGQPITPQ